MPALLRRMMKYRCCDAFVVISSMCDCHFRSSDRVTSSRRVLLTCWIGLPSMVSSAMSGVELISAVLSSCRSSVPFCYSLSIARLRLLLLGVSCPFRKMK